MNFMMLCRRSPQKCDVLVSLRTLPIVHGEAPLPVPARLWASSMRRHGHLTHLIPLEHSHSIRSKAMGNIFWPIICPLPDFFKNDLMSGNTRQNGVNIREVF